MVEKASVLTAICNARCHILAPLHRWWRRHTGCYMLSHLLLCDHKKHCRGLPINVWQWLKWRPILKLWSPPITSKSGGGARSSPPPPPTPMFTTIVLFFRIYIAFIAAQNRRKRIWISDDTYTRVIPVATLSVTRGTRLTLNTWPWSSTLARMGSRPYLTHSGVDLGSCDEETLTPSKFHLSGPVQTTGSHQIMPWLDGVTAFKFVYGEHSKTRLNVLEARMCAIWDLSVVCGMRHLGHPRVTVSGPPVGLGSFRKERSPTGAVNVTLGGLSWP
jgi:hypothetical protein